MTTRIETEKTTQEQVAQTATSVQRALRMRPLDEIASMRSRCIREFTGSIKWATWDEIQLDSGKKIDFRRKVSKAEANLQAGPNTGTCD